MAQARVYWEKQESGFCAVHALNNLLQGAYFTEIDLASIGQRIDDREKQLMAENGLETPEFLRFIARDRDESDNVNAGGNFSIQVINEALGVWGLSGRNIGSEDVKEAKQDPVQQNAFICNLGSHWFTLRKLQGMWFNLNSLNAKPEFIGPFYLSVYLSELARQGYDVFVVQGDFPPNNASLDGRGQWFPLHTIKGTGVSQAQHRPSASTSEDELKLAIALSMSQEDPAPAAAASAKPAEPAPVAEEQEEEEEDPELAQALRMSMGTGDSGTVGASSTAPVDLTGTLGDDDDLLLTGSEQHLPSAAEDAREAQAKALARARAHVELDAEPLEDPASAAHIVTMQVTFNDGAKKRRRFNSSAAAAQVYLYCKQENPDLQKQAFTLQCVDPMVHVPNDTTQLQSLGIRNNAVVRVRMLPPTSQ